MMIPITRKEKYINEIVGGGDTAPKTPQTREEFFFADILGEVIAPSPVTRVEKYLSAIAGQYSGELPEPVTRIERFIAIAAGMDVTIPTPITREEMLWANYALIVEKELSGLPPLNFTAKNTGALKNYRIYGDTVNGESVGDRTGNLFDMSTIVEGKYISSSGIETSSTAQYQENMLNHTDFINVSNDTAYSLTCVMPYSIAFDNTIAFCWFDDNESLISRDTKRISDVNLSGYSFSAISPLNATYLIINFIGYVDETTYMLNEGSTPLPYEPYGYKVPVTVSDGTDTQTTTIYLDAPLEKSGNNADYIDYETQKRHNSDGTNEDVTLPEITVTAGMNTLTVGTEVQPSNVYIKYEGAR